MTELQKSSDDVEKQIYTNFLKLANTVDHDKNNYDIIIDIPFLKNNPNPLTHLFRG